MRQHHAYNEVTIEAWATGSHAAMSWNVPADGCMLAGRHAPMTWATSSHVCWNANAMTNVRRKHTCRFSDCVSDLAEQENKGHLTPPNRRQNPDPKKGARIWPQICAENGVRQQWVDIFLALDLGPENGPQKRPAKRTQQQGQTA